MQWDTVMGMDMAMVTVIMRKGRKDRCLREFLIKFLKMLRSLFFFKKLNFHSKGENCIIKKGTFNRSEKIILGNNIYIGPGAYWDALGEVIIEDNVIIGPRSTIWSYNHNYNSDKYLPYDEKDILKKVHIEKNVWIGFGVIIAPGVRIGEGAIVAIGSVVTKNVPALTIVGGNPAKEIGKRDEEKYNLLKKKDSSYLKAKQEKKIKKFLG